MIAGVFALRATVPILTGDQLVIAQYLEASPAALGSTLLVVAAVSIAAAALLVRALWSSPSTAVVVSAAASLILAAVIAGAMMSIAWDHNPQGEIHGPGYVEWQYWFAVGIGWFLAVYLQVFLGTAVIWWAISVLGAYGRRRAA